MWSRKVQKSLLHNSNKSRRNSLQKIMLKNYQNFLKSIAMGYIGVLK